MTTALLTDLDALLQLDDFDEDYCRPSDYATATARALLNGVADELGEAIPPATIYPFGNGGLRAEWISEKRELRLSLSDSDDGRSYIYHEEGDDYDVDREVSVERLAEWLRWYSECRSHLPRA